MVKTPDRDLRGDDISPPDHSPPKDNLNQLDALLGLMADLRIIDQPVNSHQHQAIDVPCSVVTEQNIVRENTVNIDLPTDKSIDSPANQALDHHLLSKNHDDHLTDNDPLLIVNNSLVSSLQDNLPSAVQQVEENLSSETEDLATEMNAVRSLFDMINLMAVDDHNSVTNIIDNDSEKIDISNVTNGQENLDEVRTSDVLNNQLINQAIPADENSQNINNGNHHGDADQNENSDTNITINQSNSLQSEPSETDYQDSFKSLQDLLFGKEISQIDDFNTKIDKKLLAIEEQLYQPERLINLLLPVIGELLNL
ncbi:MAG: hypothetical protein ACRDB1_09000, partial [Microcoleaceae cyanobacterium]